MQRYYFFKSAYLVYLLKKISPPVVLIILILIFYHSVLNNFWLADDSQILKHAISYHPWEYFFYPKVWQELSAVSFTPWVVFSFDVDWKIFGLHPYGFYLHQLISLCLLTVIAYAVLKLWFSYKLSFFGGLLFAVSPPFAESTQLLMQRHYIEGMIFALLCIYFFVKAVRNDNSWLSVLSAFFYLLSCSAKEIYLPLICLLLLLPENNWRDRLRLIFPALCITVFYVLWRWFMLGRLLGGYGLELTWLQDATLFFPRIADAMGSGLSAGLMLWWRWVIGSSSLLVLILLFRIDKKTLFYILAVSPLILLPIVPVSPIMTPRYVWLLTFCWVVLHVITFHILIKRTDRLLVRISVYLWGLVLMSVFLYASSADFQHRKELVNRQGKEGIFFLQKGNNTDLLTNPNSPGWYYNGLLWLRKQILHLPEGPSVNFDTKVLCFELESNQEYKRVWFYDFQKDTLISENFKDFYSKLCNKDLLDKIRVDAPLSLVIKYNNPDFFWEFGPYENGGYVLLFGYTAESIYPLPLKGNRFVSFKKDLTIQFRLRYSSPEGWFAYSPLLPLKIAADKGGIEWKR